MQVLKKSSILLIISILLLSCIMLFAQDAATFIAQGDSAFDQMNNAAALQAYQSALDLDGTNYEAAWKLSRAFVDVGENFEKKKQRAEYYKKGEEFARKAVEINPDGSKGHLFLSVALGRVALDAGKKEQVRLSKEIKLEVDKALALNPNDDIALHVLGRWNRKMATLGWIQKKFANLFLGGIPKDASLENAESCFKKAIEIHPEHINHYLQLGLTLEKMDKKDEAMQFYQKLLTLPNTDADDAKYKKEAQKRIDKLK